MWKVVGAPLQATDRQTPNPNVARTRLGFSCAILPMNSGPTVVVRNSKLMGPLLAALIPSFHFVFFFPDDVRVKKKCTQLSYLWLWKKHNRQLNAPPPRKSRFEFLQLMYRFEKLVSCFVICFCLSDNMEKKKRLEKRARLPTTWTSAVCMKTELAPFSVSASLPLSGHILVGHSRWVTALELSLILTGMWIQTRQHLPSQRHSVTRL